jgi:hypothetical protein
MEKSVFVSRLCCSCSLLYLGGSRNCVSMWTILLRSSFLGSTFCGREFSLLSWSPAQAHCPGVFLLFFCMGRRSLVRFSHPKFRFAPAMDLGVMRLLGFFIIFFIVGFLLPEFLLPDPSISSSRSGYSNPSRPS